LCERISNEIPRVAGGTRSRNRAWDHARTPRDWPRNNLRNCAGSWAISIINAQRASERRMRSVERIRGGNRDRTRAALRNASSLSRENSRASSLSKIFAIVKIAEGSCKLLLHRRIALPLPSHPSAPYRALTYSHCWAPSRFSIRWLRYREARDASRAICNAKPVRRSKLVSLFATALLFALIALTHQRHGNTRCAVAATTTRGDSRTTREFPIAFNTSRSRLLIKKS